MPAGSTPETPVHNANTSSSASGACRGFRLTLSSLVCTLFLLAVALPLAYMAGVMVGRSCPVAPTASTLPSPGRKACNPDLSRTTL